MGRAPMKIPTALVLASVLVAGSVSSAGCALMCTVAHPVQAHNEGWPQSADAHDHAACDHEHGISNSKTSNIAAHHGVSCNPDCQSWLKLSARQAAARAGFNNGGLWLPKSTTFEQSATAASPPAGDSLCSTPLAKRCSSILRV